MGGVPGADHTLGWGWPEAPGHHARLWSPHGSGNTDHGQALRSPSKELGRKVSPGGFPPAFINQNYFSSTHRAHFTQITAFLKKSSVKIKAGPEAKMKAVLLRGNLHRL